MWFKYLCQNYATCLTTFTLASGWKSRGRSTPSHISDSSCPRKCCGSHGANRILHHWTQRKYVFKYSIKEQNWWPFFLSKLTLDDRYFTWTWIYPFFFSVFRVRFSPANVRLKQELCWCPNYRGSDRSNSLSWTLSRIFAVFSAKLNSQKPWKRHSSHMHRTLPSFAF